MIKKLVFGFFIFIFLFPTGVSAENNHVVISAFQVAGEGATDEFVEILNPTSSTVKITGWRLSKKTVSGSISNLLTAFPEKSLNPGERLLIGHKDSKTKADWLYSTSGSVAADNTILLFSDAGKTIVDRVGMGKANDYETKPVENPASKEVLSRENGKDTDNNYEDFYSSLAGSEETPDEGSSLNDIFFNLTVTELMPNPEGSDAEGEWIEVYNNGGRVDMGGLILRDKIGSPRQYKIPLGTFIEARSYLVFYSQKTKISLNNDGDIVELVTPFGEVLDSSEINYEKSQEGLSFSLFGDTWDWSARPTPGANNVFIEPTIAAEKKKKPKSTKKKKAAKKKKKGEVLGILSGADEEELEGGDEAESAAEKKLGIGMILVAILVGTVYTLYVNREKAVEIYNKFRTRYQKFGEEIRARIGEK